MRLVLTGRNVEITPALRQLVDRKLTKLERLLNDSAVSAQVVLTLEKYRHVTDITVHARGDHILSGHGAGQTWPASLSDAVERVMQQAQKLKERWNTRKRRAPGGRRLPPGPIEPPVDAADVLPRVVRTRYAVRAMSVDAAARRVDGGADAFLVFRNAETNALSIVYRRKDGELGLIEPGA